MKNLPLSLSMIFIALSFGCAPNPYGDTYAVGDAQKVQNVSYGVIKKVEPVNIEGEGSTVGTLAGAVVGGLIGSTIGGERDRVLQLLAVRWLVELLVTKPHRQSQNAMA
ncbi:glycine zipper 2TM domain-containing protein [Psychromonas sp. MME1]|uniref:glycine zipper 2TM domain-containing protein n=1 Tax=Psychromonas sp. MME1 TaxID=3231032 RepID=UPI0034E2CDE9